MSAKRISSIFSLGSNSSDKSSNASFAPPSSHPSHSSRGSSPKRKPLPASAQVRPSETSSSAQELRGRQKIKASPSSSADFSPPLTGDDELASVSEAFKPMPQQMASPTAKSPSNRVRKHLHGRPNSPSKGLLRPMTPVSDSGNPDSRTSSRATSPQKDFHRPFTPSSDTSRPASRGDFKAGTQPDSPSSHVLRPATPNIEQKSSKRKSWMPGKSREEPMEGGQVPEAWILASSDEARTPYDLRPLIEFQKVPDLWTDSADAIIFLHSREAYRGASFRVDSTIFAASRRLTALFHGGASQAPALDRIPEEIQNMSLLHSKASTETISPTTDGSSQGSRTISGSFDCLPKEEVHVYIPLPLHTDLADTQSSLSADDIEQMIAVRNVFAFLTNQTLVATSKQPSAFSIFLRIADFLQRYEFSNLDGSTLGEEADGNFKIYMKDFRLADVRSSREKTIEAVVLGERMRCWDLYNEGFVHAVGKYDEIVKLRSPKYYLITDTTAKRLERATLDLDKRLKSVRIRLDDFEFPSMFAGIANSTTSTESKIVRFKAWKMSFFSMSKHVMTFYRKRYGAWPPRAKSKKNEFQESGLNRILLQELFHDFSDLYDVLVDRNALTTRSGSWTSNSGLECDEQEATAPALRRIMEEYDRSIPPVQPPVPFDTPLLPSCASIRRGFDALDPRKQKKEKAKRLGDDDINRALMQSYNRDCINSTSFLQDFMKYERQAAHGKSMEEICDLRNGQWLFVYAVIQSLPLVIVDAPGIEWTKGVEYFLCEVPMGSMPWTQESQHHGWYTVAGGTGVVSLPADIIEHGVEGIYRRSHCWQMAERWTAYSNLTSMPCHGSDEEPLAPPPPIFESSTGSAPSSRSSSPGRQSQRQSVHLGLEALPLPAGVAPSGAKPAAKHDPLKSFEDILGETKSPASLQRKKKKEVR